MVTLQSYSYNCANGYIAPQTSGVIQAAFADEKELILTYQSDISLLGSQVRFNIAFFASNFQQNNSNSAYYFLPFSASTPLLTDIDLAVNAIPNSLLLKSAKINFIDDKNFIIKLRFFNTYDLENYLTNVFPNNRKRLLAGSFNATLLQDNLLSAYNTPKFIGLFMQQNTGTVATTITQYDYLPIAPTFLNFGVMNTPIFSLLVNSLNSNVVSIDTPTTVKFKVNYSNTISKVRFWLLDYTNASNNSIDFRTAYRALWTDVSTSIVQSPANTYNASQVIPATQFINGNTYYFIAVCYDTANNVVNSFVSEPYTATGTQFCKPTIVSYFKDYLNANLTSNIKTSPYDRLQSVVEYTSNCSNIISISLEFDNNVITVTNNSGTYTSSDSRLTAVLAGNKTTIVFDFRVESLWANREILFNWTVLNDQEYASVKFTQRIEVQQFQDVLPIKLIDTKLFDLANNEIDVEDLCTYQDNEFIVETTANDATAYKQLAIFDNGGEISEQEDFVGELPQLSTPDLNLVDENFVATKARFQADILRTFGGILASIAKKKVDIYFARYLFHVRGNKTPNDFGNFYPEITIPITENVLDFDFIDVLGTSTTVQYKFREGIAPPFDTLPLLTKSQLLNALASRTGDCDIKAYPTLQSGFNEATFIFQILKFGVPTPIAISYSFSATNSIDTVLIFYNKISFTLATGITTNTAYAIRQNNTTPWGLPTLWNLATLNADILALPAGSFELKIINFDNANITLYYQYL